ncbi:MAG: hypothetical protein ACRD1E_13580 [Terriglobales bacterium]
MQRPLGGSITALQADGSFVLASGRLRTASGWQPFQRFSGRYRLNAGHAALDHLAWSAGGVIWTGQGSASLDPNAVVQFDLRLQHARRSLHLTSQ